jgi:penicillin amidase
VGAANPGIPGILLGRSNFISWGVTAALTDVSDLYRETLSKDGNNYLVDGEYKPLKKEIF